MGIKWFGVFFYLVLLVILAVFSYGFVDANFPVKTNPFFYDLVYAKRGLATGIYSSIVFLLFMSYGFILVLIKRNKIGEQEIIRLIGITFTILFFAFPAFSNDIFNYIATAKITFFYHENPYVVMPVDIPNEPMLAFLHAGNKIALYGPAWIFLTAIAHFAGLGNIFLSIFTFKLLVAIFYFGILWLLFLLSHKNIWPLAFFGLNPLVTIETFLSGHNDVVMMFLALVAFYLLERRKILLSSIFVVLSILIKYATLFLLPVYLYCLYMHILHKKIAWQIVWMWAAISMYLIFLIAPLREEIYAWYLIWPLTFVALLNRDSLLAFISFGFSFGLSFRVAPFIYTRNWVGITPAVKTIVTFFPPFVASIIYVFKKNR